jgi:hypothetical protein
MRHVGLFIVALFLAPSGGCGKGSTSAVSGTATFDDKPLANAMITFIPQGETQGSRATARTDANGKFTLVTPQGEKNIVPGEYKVVVSKFLRPDGSELDPRTPPMKSDGRESLPAIYSSELTSILKETVSPDKKEYSIQLSTPK